MKLTLQCIAVINYFCNPLVILDYVSKHSNCVRISGSVSDALRSCLLCAITLRYVVNPVPSLLTQNTD